MEWSALALHDKPDFSLTDDRLLPVTQHAHTSNWPVRWSLLKAGKSSAGITKADKNRTGKV